MQLHLARTFPPRPSQKEAIPYSSEALRHDLERVRGIWEDCQANRDRNAIYGYLSAVDGLVAVWAAEGREVDRARRTLCLQRLKVSDREEPFAAVIRCTADPAKADKRTRSRWSRVMRYAAAYKLASEPLDAFIKRKGGINACEARFSHRFGRRAGKGANNGEDGAYHVALPLILSWHGGENTDRPVQFGTADITDITDYLRCYGRYTA